MTHSGGSLLLNASGTLQIAGNLTLTFASISNFGTVSFDGSADQSVSILNPLYHLNIAKTGGTLNVLSNLDIAGDINYSSGDVNFGSNTVKLVGSNAQTLSTTGLTFNDFEVAVNNNVNVVGDLDIDGNFIGTSIVGLNGGPITVAGNVTITDQSWATNTNITLDGTGNQTVSGDPNYMLPNLAINKASGTATLGGSMNLTGTLLHTAGTVDATALDLTISGIGAGSVSGSIGPINTLVLNTSGARTFTNTLAVNNGTFLINVGSLSGGKIQALGNVTLADASYSGTTEIELGGNANQQVNATTNGLLRNAIINKSGGNLTFVSDYRVGGSFTHTAGIVVSNVTTDFNGSGLAIDAAGMTFGNAIFTGTASGTLLSNLNIAGNLTFTDISSLNGFEIRVGGNLNGTDTAIAGTTGIRLNGTGTQTINVADTTNGVLSIDKNSGTVTLASNLTLNGAGQDMSGVQGTFDTSGRTLAFAAGNGLVIDSSTITGGGNITGNLTLVGNAIVDLSAAGITPGQYTQYSVSGNAALGSSSQLQVDVNGMIIGGSVGDFISGASRTGAFSSINLNNNSSLNLTPYAQNSSTTAGGFFNTAPTGTITDITVAEDAPDTVVDLAAAFSDAQHTDSELTYSIVSNTNAGLFNAVTLDNTGDTLTLGYAANLNGFADITIRSMDPYGQSVNSTFRVTVNSVNDAPVAWDDANAAIEDGAAVGGTLSVTDSDPTDTHTFALASSPSEGTAAVNSNGSYTFDPGADFQDLAAGETRDVTFTYEVTDNNGATSQASVTITVTGTNDGPVAQPGTNSAVEDGAIVNGTLSQTDADTNDTHTYALISGTSEGAAIVQSNGNYTFNPGADFQDLAAGETGDVTFTYEVTDNNGATSQASVTITVTGTNDGPVAVADTATAIEAGGVANATAGLNPSGNVLDNDLDADQNDSRTVIGVQAGSTGTAIGAVGDLVHGVYGDLVLNGDGSYEYTVDNEHPDIEALRTTAESVDDVFTYTMRDTAGSTSSQTIRITIRGQNDAPDDLNATGLIIQENLADDSLVGTVTTSDIDADDSANYQLTVDADGRFWIDASGNIRVLDSSRLNFEANEQHTITVEVSDAAGAAYQADFVIWLTDVNEFNVIAGGDADSALNQVDENASSGIAVGITVSAIDLDATNNSVHHELIDDAGGRFVIDEQTGRVFTSSNAPLNYEIDTNHTIMIRSVSSDGSEVSQTFTIQVLDLNENPIATDDRFDTLAGQTISLTTPNLVANDFDVDGDTLGVLIVSPPANGTLSIDGNGTVVYTPRPGFFGADTFSYRADDGSLLSDNVATVRIDVQAIGSPGSGGNGGGNGGGGNGGGNGSGGTTPNTDTGDGSNGSESQNTLDLAAVGGEVTSSATNSDGGLKAGVNDIENKLVHRKLHVSIVEENGESAADGSIVTANGAATLTRRERATQFDSSFANLHQVAALGDSNAAHDSEMPAAWYAAIAEPEAADGDLGDGEFIIGGLGTTLGLASIGYVMWALRGGMLMATMFAGIPSWRMLDPGVLLNAYRDDATEDDRVEEFLERRDS